jgi:carbohydrate kinase (thermoresistant glucokinase family)
MGVAGCGKTTVGERLAQRLDASDHARPWRYVEGDDFHPPANVAKMRSGAPLSDDDRARWLAALRREAGPASDGREDAGGVVLACSALKRRYRETLIFGDAGASPDAKREAARRWLIVFLRVDRDEAHRRVQQRNDHFMPAGLVADQFAVLEPPSADEPVVVHGAGLCTLDGTEPNERLIETASRAAIDG